VLIIVRSNRSAERALNQEKKINYFRQRQKSHRDYVRMFLHPISISLVESFNFVSSIWYIKIIDDVPKCIDNDFEIFV